MAQRPYIATTRTNTDTYAFMHYSITALQLEMLLAQGQKKLYIYLY